MRGRNSGEVQAGIIRRWVLWPKAVSAISRTPTAAHTAAAGKRLPTFVHQPNRDSRCIFRLLRGRLRLARFSVSANPRTGRVAEASAALQDFRPSSHTPLRRTIRSRERKRAAMAVATKYLACHWRFISVACSRTPSRQANQSRGR